jgi:hypothetical protein
MTYLDHLRARADVGDRAAAQRLADLLVGAGRVDEAIAITRDHEHGVVLGQADGAP